VVGSEDDNDGRKLDPPEDLRRAPARVDEASVRSDDGPRRSRLLLDIRQEELDHLAELTGVAGIEVAGYSGKANL
jgi:hypothetical protein